MQIIENSKFCFVAEIEDRELQDCGLEYDTLSEETPELQSLISKLLADSVFAVSPTIYISLLKPCKNKTLVFITSCKPEDGKSDEFVCVLESVDGFFEIYKAISKNVSFESAALYCLSGKYFCIVRAKPSPSVCAVLTEFGLIDKSQRFSGQTVSEHGKLIFSLSRPQPFS